MVILVDGHHGYEAFGHVPLGQPMGRNSSLAAPVWIIDPADGATAAGRVEVFGRGVAYESELSWQIFRLAGSDDTSEGDLVKDGTALVDADSGQIGEFRFSQKLDPGTYRLYVFQKDQDGRTGERQNADSKVFTIT